ncbi:MAG: TRAP transporter substrate-binding protein [Pseudomonadota bacterium]|nr:TRAP transporter substrate-binding protein [Pseudomonadota bacterium]
MLTARNLAATLGLALPTLAAPAYAEDVVLRYSNWLPPGFHLVEDVMKPWIADVEEVTEGRVTVEMLPKVVGTVAGQYDVLADGLADVSLWCPCYSPGRFPLLEGFELPFLGDDPITRSVASWQMYEKYLADTSTFEDIKVLSLFASNSGHLMTVDEPVTTAAGFDGMRLRTPSPVATDVLNLLGSVPVPKPMTELYELAAGGVVDGAVLPIDTFLAFNLDEVLKQMNLVEGGLYNTMMVVGMNPAKWEQISEEDRAAIEEVSGEHLARVNGEVLQNVADNTLAALDSRGVSLNRMPEDEIEAMKVALKPIWDAWIDKAQEAGMSDPNALLTDLAELAGGGL